MTDGDRIAALEAEVKALRARVDDIFEALKFESASTTRHFGKVHGHITELHEYLMPALYNLFPGIARDNREIAAIMRRPPPDTTET